MSNLFRRAGDFLTRQLMRGASPAGRVVYVRKIGGAEIDLTGRCWVGRTVFSRLPVDGGAAIVFGDRDYLVPVKMLASPPVRGDQFEEEMVGANSPKVFEVISVLDEPEWRYADPGETIYRVHTKRAE